MIQFWILFSKGRTFDRKVSCKTIEIIQIISGVSSIYTLSFIITQFGETEILLGMFKL